MVYDHKRFMIDGEYLSERKPYAGRKGTKVMSLLVQEKKIFTKSFRHSNDLMERNYEMVGRKGFQKKIENKLSPGVERRSYVHSTSL